MVNGFTVATLLAVCLAFRHCKLADEEHSWSRICSRDLHLRGRFLFRVSSSHGGSLGFFGADFSRGCTYFDLRD
jgi:hypothetical protein